MKTFATTLRLAFAAMLVCLAFGVRPARAYQVGEYNCNSGWQNCDTQTMINMGNCMTDCTDNGGGDPNDDVCYTEEQTIGWNDGESIVNDDTTCAAINQSQEQCAQACVDNFENSTAECLESYCTYVG